MNSPKRICWSHQPIINANQPPPTPKLESKYDNQIQKQSMIKAIIPKLPMRAITLTKDYYLNLLGFEMHGEYEDYLIVGRDTTEIHFFQFQGLDPKENYGQVYIRTSEIDTLYKSFLARGVAIHPNGKLATKAWGQREFSLLDPDNNLLTFGQDMDE